MNKRDLLNIAIGDNDINNFRKKLSGTYLDKLPKDLIEYIQSFTGPIDCYYTATVIYPSYGTNTKYRFRAFVNKSKNEASILAVKKGYIGYRDPDVAPGKLIFIEGKAHIAVPVYNNRVFGISPPSKKRKIVPLKSKQCTARTQLNKRCKKRVMSSSGSSQLIRCNTHIDVQ